MATDSGVKQIDRHAARAALSYTYSASPFVPWSQNEFGHGSCTLKRVKTAFSYLPWRLDWSLVYSTLHAVCWVSFPALPYLQGSAVWCEGPNGYLVPGIVKVQCSKDNVKVELDANEVHCMLLGAGFVAS